MNQLNIDVSAQADPDTANGKRESAGQLVGSAPTFNLTDLGNARRLVRDHGRDIRYCFVWGRWLIWDGTRWAPDETGEIYRRAKETVTGIYAEAQDAGSKEGREAIAKHGMRSEGSAKLKAMVELAESEPGIPIMPNQLDANSWLFNVENGTLDLREAVLHPHRRGDLITKVARVVFDPKADCPTWEIFLKRIMSGNEDLITFLQRAVGYALTGSVREQVLFFLHGTGANGKSTLLETISALLGDFATQTPTETLLTKQGSSISNDVARLRGARLVTAVEADRGCRLNESLIKQLTGADTVTARFLHREFFEFKPQFKLFLAANHKPTIRGMDNAIWRRIRLIPFEVVIADAEQDKDLPAKLRQELSGILNWALEGFLVWQLDGLGLPNEVKLATELYRSEMDVIGDFLASRCVQLPSAKVNATALFNAYREWCEVSGEKSKLSQRWFGSRLSERGFTRVRGGPTGAVMWEGLQLKDERFRD